MSGLSKYLNETGELPRDVLLGYVAIYGIADKPHVGPEELEKRFANLGLDASRLPKSIKPINAFEKATASINGTSWSMNDGTTATLLCREVANSNAAMTRHLVREIRDAENVRLRHNTVAELVFYKPVRRSGKYDPQTAAPRLTAMPANMYPEEQAHVQAALQAIKTAYIEMTEYFDGQALRRVVREYLLTMDGMELKGSVYFVPIEKADEVQKLAEVVNSLGGNSYLNLMPLIDLPSQRTWVVQRFQEESVENLQKLAAECARVMDTRKTITTDAYSKLHTRYKDVMGQAERYQGLIKTSLDFTAGAAEFALDALGEVQRRMLEQED